MKKIPMYAWIVIAYVVAILLYCSLANAVDYGIHVEWMPYSVSGMQTEGFILYQEGSTVCKFPGGNITSGDCTVNITKIQTPFTLTAAFSNNLESSHSEPYVFKIPIPAPTDIKITIK